jgi:hypothetical protein
MFTHDQRVPKLEAFNTYLVAVYCQLCTRQAVPAARVAALKREQLTSVHFDVDAAGLG